MTQGTVELPWWQRGVIYQIYPRSFQDSGTDGIGDLQGIIDRLDYLSGAAGSLGVDAIWISPFYPSPMADLGYDVADYRDVDPLFGDLATFDRLLAEAHGRGIRVIVDYVPNHTSDQHPWFVASRRGRDDPKRDWYIWRDPAPGGGPPNNWGSVFGGPAWSYDPDTAQYYLHNFLKEQPDLNWRNPAVRAEMMDVLRFWLDRGVDGFRMDVVGMIVKDAALRDNPPNPNAPPDLPPNDLAGRQLFVHNLYQEELHDVLRDFRRLLDGYGERVAIGELAGDINEWVRCYGEQGDELHLPFNFRLIDQPWDARAMQQSVDELEAALPRFAWPNFVLGNHDVPRLAGRVGGQDQARLAAMMLLTLRGTPTLYYGDEIGLENGDIRSDQIRDPQGRNLGAGRTRDVARTPMQWDAGPYAGFSTAEPWLPVSDDYRSRNVAAQAADPRSILNLYRRLLALRRSSAALTAGRYRPLAVHDACFVYWREAFDERRLIALNFTAESQNVAIADDKSGRIVLSTYLDREEPVDLARLALRPNEGVIVEA